MKPDLTGTFQGRTVSKSKEDKELIDRFLRGEEEAFDGLVIKYKGMVFTVCYRMLADRQEALDVSQDVFVKLYTVLKDFRFESSFSTYLYRITMNFCKNRLKALSRRHKHEAFSIDVPLVTPEGHINREFESSAPGPRQIARKNEQQEYIQQALAKLPADYRQIIVLREIEGLRYEEIAVILDIDIGTVKSRLSRGRSKLRELLKGVL